MSKPAISAELQYSKVPTNEAKKDIEGSKCPAAYGYGIRHIQLIIFFLCVVTSFIARSHLGVTLVAMTTCRENACDAKRNISFHTENYTNINFTKDSIRFDVEGIDSYELNQTNNESVPDAMIQLNSTEQSRSIYSTFTWSKPIQEMVLTSFFTGYCLMMLPISLVCQRWGGKVPLQVSMFVNGVVSILTPTLAYWGGWQAVCVCRLLQGFAQAGTFPGTQTLLAQWVPDCEKGTLVSYVYTGTTVGSVIGFQIGGYLSDAVGWPAAFWMVGALCLLLLALLSVFGAASPQVHNTISEGEKTFIMGQTKASVLRTSRAPWKALLTTKPLLANYLTAVGSGVAYIFFFTQLPSYLHYVYGINVKNSGMLSSLPYIVSIFASVAFGVTSDYLINHNILSRKNARRCSNLVSQVGMACALVGASHASTAITTVIWFVIFMVSMMGIHTGWVLNQIDLSPKYSGTLIAISSCATNLVAVLMPFVISYVIVDLKDVFQWRIMLYLEAAIALVPSIIFAVFISAEVQPWNDGNLSQKEIADTQLKSMEKSKTEK